MTDYIEREAFKSRCVDVLEGIAKNPKMTRDEMHVIAALHAVCEIIDDMTAADVKPVVLCRDCVYRKAAKVNDYGFLICSASGMDITDDDYCSYGVKEKEEDA